ncbi:hypothetical protein ZWY2020_039849 [Hordeum vulgare]|nr:hypothetical protein ZWY2020_039849 [Hordeum vulgare]
MPCARFRARHRRPFISPPPRSVFSLAGARGDSIRPDPVRSMATAAAALTVTDELERLGLADLSSPHSCARAAAMGIMPPPSRAAAPWTRPRRRPCSSPLTSPGATAGSGSTTSCAPSSPSSATGEHPRSSTDLLPPLLLVSSYLLLILMFDVASLT